MIRSGTIDLSLMLVTDEQLVPTERFVDIIRAGIRGGVTCVQLRDKTSPDRKFLDLAIAVREITSKAGVGFIINDRIDIAQIVGADGVHIGKDDIPSVYARKLLPEQSIVGISLEPSGEILGADTYDYIGVSPVFTTGTKPELEEGWGIEGLGALRNSHKESLVAIGGISVANAAEVLQAGADGLAVVSAILTAKDPERAAAMLREVIEKHRRSRS